jgi:hypothetical protein
MKRVTIVAGHYGSGKTNFAVNYALEIAKSGKKTSLSDLDIVNPYFRSKDSEKVLADAGIRFISSDFANSNVDVPAIPASAYSVCADKESWAVVDVGGDDRGALALGRYVPEILAENNYEMLFVINCFRPLTRDAKSTVEVMREIEEAAKMRFTGIINNSNVGEETTAQDVISSLEYAKEVSDMTSLPVKFTSVHHALYDELKDKIENLFPIRLYIRQTWKAE